VLQCVAVCCSALQCVAVYWSVLQCIANCCSVLQGVALCCSILQRVAACCSVLQRVVVCCNMSGHANSKTCQKRRIHIKRALYFLQKSSVFFAKEPCILTGTESRKPTPCCLQLQCVAVCCCSALQCVAVW